MNIITGYKGTPHINAQQDRDINSAIFTNGVYILNIGSKMAATIVSANEITIADGLVIAQGCAAEIARGTSESMSIDNGDQGMLRKDLIVLRYTKEASTGVEDMALAVIKGTPAASSPADPSYNTGSIANGDTLVDFPLYRVSLNGITIETVTRIPSIVSVAKTSDVSAVSSALSTLSNTVTSLSNKIGNTAMGTVATTVTAAIRELLTKINTLTTNLSTTNSNLSTTNSNVTAVRNRTTALETKTAGLVRVITYDVAANSNNYKQLNAGGMYKLILNGGTTSNGVRGEYLIGVTGSKALGIKAISAASVAEVTDGGSGLLKVHNTASIVLRATLITTYGS